MSDNYKEIYQGVMYGGEKLTGDQNDHLEFAIGILKVDAEEHYNNPSHADAINFLQTMIGSGK